MKKMHSHPLNILETSSRFLFLLFIPLFRGLQSSFYDFHNWRTGIWLDILVIGIIVLLGIYRWSVYVFSFDEEGILLRKGFFLRKQRYLAYKHLTSVSVIHPWYYAPFHVVHLKADTDGGNAKFSDFSITVRKDVSDEILSVIQSSGIKPTGAKHSYLPGDFYIAVFSVITSNSLTGVIFITTVISKAGDIFGEEIPNLIIGEFTKIAGVLAFGLPPAAAILGYTILFCWLLSFSMNLFRHLRFSSSRKGNFLEVRSGLFSKRHYTIAINGINSLMIRQSILSKIFGFFSVFIHCTGYGKHKNETGVLMPSGKRKDLFAGLTLLIPEIPLATRKIKPKRRNLSRFLLIPILFILSGLVIGVLGICTFPKFRDILLFLLIVLEVPLCWWLAVRIYAFFRNGIGGNRKVFTLYYTLGYRILTCSIPREKIVKTEISQSPFQIRSDCCNVTFYIYGEKPQKHTVANLNKTEVLKLLKEWQS